jgi:aspartate aminotransferase
MQRIQSLNSQFQPELTAHEYPTITMAPPDPILSLAVAFKADTDSRKVNLGIGAYRDEAGKPYVFPVVRKAEEMVLAKKLDKEYTTIDGEADFNRGARGVIFGWDHPIVNDKRVITAQALSGSGALRVLGEFLMKFKPSPIYLSSPTWGNHNQMFGLMGFDVREYRYFDKKTKGLDIKGMLEDLEKATPGSIILLHACAHNPTGVDPTLEEWKAIAEVCRRNKLYPFFDAAYQGFVSGDLNKDAVGLRYFVEQGFEMVIA